MRIVHHGQGAVVDMGNNLVTKRQEGILVGFLVLMDVDGGDLQGVVPFGLDLVVGDAFVGTS